MAAVYESQNDSTRALEVYECALAIFEKSLGPDHPDTGQTSFNMANTFQRQGKLACALECFERTLPIFEKSLGPNHQHTSHARDVIRALRRHGIRQPDTNTHESPNSNSWIHVLVAFLFVLFSFFWRQVLTFTLSYFEFVLSLFLID